LRWFGLRKAQSQLGLLGVQWTVIGHDWEWSGDRVFEHVLRHTSAGGIICLHDGRDTRANPDISSTLYAVRLLVPELKRRGYRFETVSELLRDDIDQAMQVSGVFRS
jgi:peptidoglycan/xylan/chitin deacetylase (PgdA/CDA1 family)